MKKQKLQIGDRAKIIDETVNGAAVGQIVEILAEQTETELGMIFVAKFIDSNEKAYLSEAYLRKLNRYAVLKPTRHTPKQFRFNLIGDNSEPIATSETYTRKAKALQTLKEYFNDFKIINKT